LINNLLEAKNGPIGVSENRPTEQLALSHGQGKWITNKELEELAVEKYQINRRGLTFEDVIEKFHCKKKKAQLRLKNACLENVKDGKKCSVLFRLEDERTNPQQYYPSCIKATIIENVRKRQNRLIDPTGVSLFQHPYIEKLKARYVYELLSLLQNEPISIHKLHLKVSIDKNYYKEINIEQVTQGNKSKYYETNIGSRNVKYQVYPDGTVMIYISCSNTPFKLEVEEDVSSFFAFLGQVKDRLVYFLNDLSESAIPPIMDWILVQCDLNKDVGINIIEELSIPNLQLRIHDRIFRLYVKSIQGSSCYRLEESRQVNQEIRFAIPEIMANSNTSHHSYYDSNRFQYIQ
jgi:hypothetical protein